LEDCRKRRKSSNMALIEYQKAFGSVSHSWVENSTELIGVNNKIFKCCKVSMEKWRTKIR
jgi:hypothetical protein